MSALCSYRSYRIKIDEKQDPMLKHSHDLPLEADAEGAYIPAMGQTWKEKIFEGLRVAVQKYIERTGAKYSDICDRTKDVEPKHLSAFMRGKGGFDMLKVEQIARVVGVDLLALIEYVQKGTYSHPERDVPAAFLRTVTAGLRSAGMKATGVDVVKEIDKRTHRDVSTKRPDPDARGLEVEEDFPAAHLLVGDFIVVVPVASEDDCKHEDVVIAATEDDCTVAQYNRDQRTLPGTILIPNPAPGGPALTRTRFKVLARMIQLVRDR